MPKQTGRVIRPASCPQESLRWTACDKGRTSLAYRAANQYERLLGRNGLLGDKAKSALLRRRVGAECCDAPEPAESGSIYPKAFNSIAQVRATQPG